MISLFIGMAIGTPTPREPNWVGGGVFRRLDWKTQMDIFPIFCQGDGGIIGREFQILILDDTLY